MSHHQRFHKEHAHLSSPFGNDWFANAAEQFARFFGTPRFLIGQTVVVAIWLFLNLLGVFHFDPYPFILLNLMFSLQAAYAAPLILLASTRSADRDKANSDADARHREDIAQQNTKSQDAIINLINLNTDMTQQIKDLSEKVVKLTEEIHKKTAGVS